MAISAADVKQLRDRTGAGMMDCKKALTEAGGDMDEAVKILRSQGLAAASKKAHRAASVGTSGVVGDSSRMVVQELNCETDFVARNPKFQEFAEALAAQALDSKVSGVDELRSQPFTGDQSHTVEEMVSQQVATIGENISVRRFIRVESDNQISSYRHGVRIGVLVELAGSDAQLGKDLAMHVAAHDPRPVCVSEEQVPADMIAAERDIFTAQARESGKHDNIIEKMISGRIRKFLGEITLLGQSFVKDPDLTVGKLLEQSGARVVRFERVELGEGIEKKSENFADEVMAQVKGG